MPSQDEKAVSIAWKISPVSNWKFLKLLPGPIAEDWVFALGLTARDSAIVALLPVELVLAFQTLIPSEAVIIGWSAYELVENGNHR